MGGFDVYVRGIGPQEELDPTGRYLLFTRKEERRMPTPREILDSLIFLVFAYGDSQLMAEEQKRFYEKNIKIIPKPYKLMHGCPTGMSKGSAKKEQKKKYVIKRYQNIFR